MKTIAILLSIVLVNASAPLGTFCRAAEPESPLPIVSFPTSNAIEAAQVLSMVRGKPGEQGTGEGGIEVTSSQRFLTVFLTDPQGEFKQTPAVKMTLVGPSGRPCVSSVPPKADPLADLRAKAYMARLQKSANLQGVGDPDVMLDRLEKAQKVNPMPKNVADDIVAARRKLLAQRNFAYVLPNGKTNNTSVAVVLNPTPGLWKLRVEGGDREGFLACLAAGQSEKSLTYSDQLWSKAVKGFGAEEEQLRGPAADIDSAMPASYPSKLSCAICKAMVVLGIGLIGFFSFLLICAMVGVTFGVGDVLVILLMSLVFSALAAGTSLTPRSICRKFGPCS